VLREGGKEGRKGPAILIEPRIDEKNEAARRTFSSCTKKEESQEKKSRASSRNRTPCSAKETQFLTGRKRETREGKGTLK